MSNIPPVHVSLLTQHQHCPRQVLYSDPDWGLGFRSRTDNEYILMGNWVHYQQRLVQLKQMTPLQACLATLARQYELWAKWDIDDTYQADLQTRFINLMQAHSLWQRRDEGLYSDKNLTWVYVEEGFSVPCAGYTFEGQWDGIVRHEPTGGLYVFERKTSVRPNEIELGVQWDAQPIGYSWVAEKIMGEPVVGVIYEIIRNCDPSHVDLKQNGLPTKDKNKLNQTTYEVYYETLKRAAGDNWNKVLGDYADELEYLEVAPNPVFRRVPLMTLRQDVDNWPQYFGRKAEQIYIEHMRGDNATYNLDRYTCYQKCPFRDVCLAHRDGMEWKTLLMETFVERAKERL